MITARQHVLWATLTLATAACGGCNNPPPPPQQPVMPLQTPPPLPPAPPQPAPCDVSQSQATSTSLLARGAAEAPRMKPEGAPMCGVVAEGQTMTGPLFTVEQGYCYTFLGQSLPPVSQMEMVLIGDAGALIAPIVPTMANAAQAQLLVSTTPGERVSMAEKESCYQWAFPVPGTVKLVLKARAGSGPVSAQVFRKKKL